MHRFLTKGGLSKLNDSGFSDKSTAFSSVSFSEELGKECNVIAVGTDGMAGQFRVLDEKELLMQTMQGKETRSTAHSIMISDSFKNLIVGTEKGSIKTYAYPLIGQSFD